MTLNRVTTAAARYLCGNELVQYTFDNVVVSRHYYLRGSVCVRVCPRYCRSTVIEIYGRPRGTAVPGSVYGSRPTAYHRNVHEL